MWELKRDKKADYPGAQENFTFFSRDVVLNGVINCEGTFRIDGRLEGEIHSTGHLMIGEGAVVKGTIIANTLTSSGRIKGTVTASGKVELLKSAVLIGKVSTPVLCMEEGAHFQGSSDMGSIPSDEQQSQTSPDVIDLAVHRDKAQVGQVGS